MKINVKITKLFKEGKIKAYVNICIEDVFLVTGVKLIDGKNGIFMGMPSKKLSTGEYKDICFPINQSTRFEIHNEVMKQYYLAEEENKNEEQNG